MRILMYCPYFPPQYSGAAKQALALARQLTLLNHYIEFITIRDAGLPEFEILEGFPVHRIEVNGRRNQEIPFWPNFFRFAWKNRHRFDILHSHGAHYINSVVGPIAKMVGWKSLVKSTMSNDDLSGLKKSASGILHYFFLKMVDAYIGISFDLVEEFEENDFDKKRIYYIPNGVDTVRFHPARVSGKKEIRKKLGLPLNKLIVLSVGVYDHRKNIGWLVKEWVKTNGFGTNAILLTIGPTSIYDTNGDVVRLLKKIASNHSDKIKLLDHVNNIHEYYRASDVFALPSFKEGLPNVVLEAMASGIPCIATRASGTKQLVINDITGYQYESNNSDEFSEKLHQILNPSCIVQMGKNARMEIENKYSIEKIALHYEKLYRNILDFKIFRV